MCVCDDVALVVQSPDAIDIAELQGGGAFVTRVPTCHGVMVCDVLVR